MATIVKGPIAIGKAGDAPARRAMDYTVPPWSAFIRAPDLD
jgi:hypothetical protein